MLQDIFVAIIAGLVATTVMTGMMLINQRIGLPAVDVHGILGYVTQADRKTGFGYIMHWVLGAFFAIFYIWLFRVISGNLVLWGALMGIVHWLLVGGFFAFAPHVHAGIKVGSVKEPGAFMLKSLGVVGFIGGLIGHIIFGITVALVYGWIGG
jgi:hypothetical protein